MWVRVPPRVLSFLLQAGQVPEMSPREQANSPTLMIEAAQEGIVLSWEPQAT